MRAVYTITIGAALGIVLAVVSAYLYLMGYTPMFEERLHHF